MRQLHINAIPSQTAATVNSAAILAVNLFYCSAQISVTGAGAGTLVIQASDDDLTNEPTLSPTNWSNIPSATVSVTGAGTYLIPTTTLCYQYVRVSYTNTGTGTIAVTFKALGD
jgi:hypothetical protein